MKKFYGEQEIVDMKAHPVHENYQVLVFKDGTEKVLPTKMVGVAVTDKPIDLTELRKLRCFPVVADILKVFLDWDIHTDEIDFINLRVTMSINESLKKANEILWGVSEVEQTMLHVHDVLMKAPAPKKEEAVVSPIQQKDL